MPITRLPRGGEQVGTTSTAPPTASEHPTSAAAKAAPARSPPATSADAFARDGAPAAEPTSALMNPAQGGVPSLVALRCKDPTQVAPPDQKRDPPPPIRAGVAWGDVVERETPQAPIDPVWFTFDGVIPEDDASIEVQGSDGEWRQLPALLSRSEQQRDGEYRFILQTSIEEAEGLMLRPGHACAFRIRDAHGVASEPTPPVTINDPRDPLARPDFRPMEDRFAGDNGIRNPVFLATPATAGAANADAICQASIKVDDAGVHLKLPAGSLDPGVVLETHPPVFARGHGVRAALAYPGHNETRANPDGSLEMTLPDKQPLVLRARHASTGRAEAVALLSNDRLIPWSSDPFGFLQVDGNFDWNGYAAAVKIDNIKLSSDGSTIEAGPGTVPVASFVTARNVSARGLRWADAHATNRVDVRPDGSFSIPVRDTKFGGLRVNDALSFIIAPDIQGLDDGLALSMTFDGERISLKSQGSLAGARKAGYDVAPKNGGS